MPRLRNLNAEDRATIDALINEAKNRPLTSDEIRRLWFLSNPDNDYKIDFPGRHGAEAPELYLDLYNGQIYELLKDGVTRSYVHFVDEKLSDFLNVSSGGGGSNRGGGVFARFAPVKSKALRNALPEFPRVPHGVKVKFPELLKDWNKYEEELQEWVRSVQDNLS